MWPLLTIVGTIPGSAGITVGLHRLGTPLWAAALAGGLCVSIAVGLVLWQTADREPDSP